MMPPVAGSFFDVDESVGGEVGCEVVAGGGDPEEPPLVVGVDDSFLASGAGASFPFEAQPPMVICAYVFSRRKKYNCSSTKEILDLFVYINERAFQQF